jgi:lipoate synthase
MTAKEYLSQAWRIQLRIESLREIMTSLRSAVEYAAPALSETPKSATLDVHKNENMLVCIMEYRERIRAEYKKLDEVMATITGIGDPVTQALIVKRYVHRKTWEEISREVNFSMTQVYRHHAAALEVVEKLIANGRGWE